MIKRPLFEDRLMIKRPFYGIRSVIKRTFSTIYRTCGAISRGIAHRSYTSITYMTALCIANSDISIWSIFSFRYVGDISINFSAHAIYRQCLWDDKTNLSTAATCDKTEVPATPQYDKTAGGSISSCCTRRCAVADPHVMLVLLAARYVSYTKNIPIEIFFRRSMHALYCTSPELFEWYHRAIIPLAHRRYTMVRIWHEHRYIQPIHIIPVTYTCRGLGIYVEPYGANRMHALGYPIHVDIHGRLILCVHDDMQHETYR